MNAELSPSPSALLEAIAGKWLASRLTLWPAPEPKPLPTIGDDFQDAAKRVERRQRLRRLGVVGALVGLASWTAWTFASNQAALAALGPTGAAWLAYLWFSIHERSGRLA